MFRTCLFMIWQRFCKFEKPSCCPSFLPPRPQNTTQGNSLPLETMQSKQQATHYQLCYDQLKSGFVQTPRNTLQTCTRLKKDFAKTYLPPNHKIITSFHRSKAEKSSALPEISSQKNLQFSGFPRHIYQLRFDFLRLR